MKENVNTEELKEAAREVRRQLEREQEELQEKQEQLWGIPNLAQLAGSWQQTGKLPPRSNDIDRIVK